jgi:2-polyprenyl-3-methyl-5-hydroxy-6-metoxy-1,4-benzoquinol methylase
MIGAQEERDRHHFDSIANRLAAKDLAPSSRPARRRRVEQTIAAVPDEDFERVLDVGCGAGFAAVYLRGRYRTYIGVDHSQRLIDVAVERNAGDGVEFETTSIDDFNPPWRFDLIFMIGVLHHLEHAARSLEKMVSWLEPGGYLVANEPQPANPLIRTARRARLRFDASYSGEQEEISAAQLRAFFEGAGLEEIAITPQGVASTPFAEVVLRPYALMAPLARLACALDSLLERRPVFWISALSWNLIGCGRAPTSTTG